MIPFIIGFSVFIALVFAGGVMAGKNVEENINFPD